MPCLQHRKTERRLTRCTRSQASSSVSRTDASSSGEIPALLKSTSMRPKRSRASRVQRADRVLVGDVGDDGVVAAGVGRTSTPTTRAPSRAQAGAVAAPMPPAAPVTTATLPVHAPGHQLPSVAMKIVLTSV